MYSPLDWLWGPAGEVEHISQGLCLVLCPFLSGSPSLLPSHSEPSDFSAPVFLVGAI